MKIYENKENLILIEYDISCDLFDICRRFQAFRSKSWRNSPIANKCPPRLLINYRLINWFWYKTMIVYVSQVYSQHY